MKKLICKKYLHYPKRFLVTLFFLSIFIVCAVEAIGDDKFTRELPFGAGRDVTVDNCTGCHSPGIILQNSMTWKGWDEIITVMQNKHGLWDLAPEVRNQILNYLSTVRGIAGKKSETRKFNTYRYEYKPNPIE